MPWSQMNVVSNVVVSNELVSIVMEPKCTFVKKNGELANLLFLEIALQVGCAKYIPNTSYQHFVT